MEQNTISPASSAVTVKVPARPEYLYVLRSVAASVAGQLDFPYDAVDDLRLATDEACSQLLAVRSETSVLEMRVTTDGPVVHIRICLDAPVQAWPPGDLQRTLAWHVLSALADEAEFGMDEAGPVISLTMRGAA